VRSRWLEQHHDDSHGGGDVDDDVVEDDDVVDDDGYALSSSSSSLLPLGDATIPPSSTVMLLYNGRQWVDIEALKAPVQVGVQCAILQYSYPTIPTTNHSSIHSSIPATIITLQHIQLPLTLQRLIIYPHHPRHLHPISPTTHHHLSSLQHLTSVKEFRAANDLQIGNHTLSALRFQATGIRKVIVVDSIVFV